MRIRKNTKLSSLLLATAGYGGERPETYNCHFNQSPWDVIPVGDSDDSNLLDSSWFLPSPLSSPPRSLIHKFDGVEDNNNNNNHRNVSLGDSNGVAYRLNRSVLSDEGLNLMPSEETYEPMDRSKSKSDETKTSGDEEKVVESIPLPPKRGRPRGTGKKLTKAQSFNAASTNPYEFYYYSGFGPRWGKKRGDNGENVVMADNNVMSDKKSEEGDGKTASFEEGSSSVNGFDYMEEDDNGNNDIGVDDEESDHGRKEKDEKIMMKKTKRARKPVKERSLKSLM